MLTKAGEARDAALAARDAAEAEYQLSLDAVVQASSGFAIVKEQLEVAELELAALDPAKQVLPLAQGIDCMLSFCLEDQRDAMRTYFADVY